MTDTLGARTVFLLTLLGLVGCSVIATLHPPEDFDPERVTEQAGRNVAIRLHVMTVQAKQDWLRGAAYVADAPASEVAWLWFRAPEPGPLAGDLLVGHAQVSVDARGTALILDGAFAARITPGPHPVPVHWDELLSTPERLEGRLLLVNGAVDGARLRAPEGGSVCPLTGDIPTAAYAANAHVLHLLRTNEAPGWACRLEA